MEDPKLHKTPDGWSSHQRFLNKTAIFIGPALIILGIIFIILPLLVSTESDGMGGIIIGIFILIMGLFIAIAAIYSNYDKKETWYRVLPYNKILYERMNLELVFLLKKKRYGFKSSKLQGFSTAVDRKTGKVYGRIYRIRLKDKPEIEITLALEIIHHKYSGNSYHFPLHIKNIRMENLDDAWELHWIIKNAMLNARSDQFDEVH